MADREGPTADDRSAYQELLAEHVVLTLATADGDGPYDTPLYHAIADAGDSLVFVSDPDSRHGIQLASDPRAAAGVFLETRDLTELRGIQLTGLVDRPEGPEAERLPKVFLARFPEAELLLALRSSVRVHRLRVQWARVTDNRRGFGHKSELRWPRDGSEADG